MKIIFSVSLILLFFGFFPLNAQHYRCVNPDRQGLYAYDNEFGEFLESLKLDTFSTEGEDTIYQSMQTLRQVDSLCWDPRAPIWIGYLVVVRPNGTTLFLNRQREAITIETLAEPGDSWLAWSGDALYVMCELTECSVEEVLGLQDSVKKISFHAYDQNDNPVDNRIEDIPLWISKHYGIVKGPDFFLFPDQEEAIYGSYNWYWPVRRQTQYELIGLNNPDIGLQPMCWKDIWDYDVGDEFHINRVTWCDDYRCGTQTILKIVDVEQVDDSIKNYRIERVMRSWRSCDNAYYDYMCPAYTIDTVTSTNHPGGFLYTLPGEVFFSEWGEDYTASVRWQTRETYNTEECFQRFISDDPEGHCWQSTCNFFEDVPESVYYSRGKGGPYWSHYIPWESYVDINELEYYKKADRTWGRPFGFTDIESLKTEFHLVIYPNPAREILYVEFVQGDGPYTCSIYNNQGALMKNADVVHQDPIQIDIGDLWPGLYFIKLTNGKNNSTVRPFIKD